MNVMKFTRFIGRIPMYLILLWLLLGSYAYGQSGTGCAPALVSSTSLYVPQCPDDQVKGIRIEFKAGGTLPDPAAFANHSWAIRLKDVAANCYLETILDLNDPRVTRTGNSLRLDILEDDLLFFATNPCASRELKGKTWEIRVTQFCDAPNTGPSPAGNADTIVVPLSMGAFGVASNLYAAPQPLGFCPTTVQLDALLGEQDTIRLNWLQDVAPANQSLTLCIGDWVNVPASENYALVLQDGAGGVFDQSDATAFLAGLDANGGDTLQIDSVVVEGKNCVRLTLKTDGDGTDFSATGVLAIAKSRALACETPLLTTVDQVGTTNFRIRFDAGMRTTGHRFKVRVYQGGCAASGGHLSPGRPNTDNTHVFETLIAANDPRLTRLDRFVLTGTDTVVTDSFELYIASLGFTPDPCTCYQAFVYQVCDGMNPAMTSGNWGVAQTKTFAAELDCEELSANMLVTPETCNQNLGGVRLALTGGPCGARQVEVNLDGHRYVWYNVPAINGAPVTSTPGVFSTDSENRLVFEVDSLVAGDYLIEVVVKDTLSPASQMRCDIPVSIDLLDATRPTAVLHLEHANGGPAYQVDTAGRVLALGATPSGNIVNNKINLGVMKPVSGSCAIDLDVVLQLSDNCQLNGQLLEAAIAVHQGKVAGTVFSGSAAGTRNLQLNLGSSIFEFDVVIHDNSDLPQRNTNRITLYGRVADQDPPILYLPGNPVYQIPSCATTTDVYFTVQAADACEGSIDPSAAVRAPGLNLVYLGNGLFRATKVSAGTYQVVVEGVTDAAGNVASTRSFQVQVTAPGSTVSRQIVGAGDLKVLVPFCAANTAVTFDLFVLDPCTVNPVLSSVMASGGYQVIPVSSNRFRIEPRMPADQVITITARAAGAPDYSFEIRSSRSAENTRPDITLPGNLTFTLPACSQTEVFTLGVFVDDDCTPLSELDPVASLGNRILTPSKRTTNSGQLYLEYAVPIGKADHGSLFVVEVSDGYTTSAASAQLSVLQESAATFYACNDNLILTLGNGCSRSITPSMVLKGNQSTICNNQLQVIVEAKDESGRFLGYYHKNQVVFSGTYNYAVLPTGDQYLSIRNGKIVAFNAAAALCRGTLTAEDKSGPAGVCPADTYTATRRVVLNEWQGRLEPQQSFFPQVLSCYNPTWFGETAALPANPALVPNPAFPAYLEPGAVHHYDTWTFRPASNGKYTFSLAAGFEGTLALFQQQGKEPQSGDPSGWFDPAFPCSNIVSFGEAVFGANPGQVVQRLALTLQAGKAYTLLVSSRAASISGSFLVQVERDGAKLTSDKILEYFDPLTDAQGNTLDRWAAFPVREVFREFPLYCDNLNEVLIKPLDPRCYTLAAPYDAPASIDNQLKEKLSWTGFPQLSDNCGPVTVCVSDLVKKTGDCGAMFIERTFTASDARNNAGEWFAALPGVPGKGSSACVQRIYFSVPAISNITLPHAIQYLECDEGFATDIQGNPHPQVTGFPFLQSAFGYHDLNKEWCNLAATYADEARIASCAGGYNVRREWTIMDWCRPGKSLVYRQLIRVGDFTPPTLDVSALLSGTPGLQFRDGMLTYGVSPFDCDADLLVPRPQATDNCAAAITLRFQVQEWVSIPVLDHFGNVVGAKDEWQVIREGSAGSFVRALPADRTYRYKFEAKDECLLAAEAFVPFQVLDLAEPMLVCEDVLQVTLGGGSFDAERGAYARMEKTDLQKVVSDNCGPVEYWVRRVVAPSCYAAFDFDGDGKVLGDELKMAQVQDQSVAVTHYQTSAAGVALATFTEAGNSGNAVWQPFVEFFCCDAGEDVLVEILAIDASGNSSRCLLRVRVTDKTRPYCIAPSDFRGSGLSLPADFHPPANLSAYLALSPAGKTAFHTQLDELFGVAQMMDNCSSVSVRQEVTALNWHCGAGKITRRFLGTDAWGNTNATACFQNIDIQLQHEYGFTFPADRSGTCAAMFEATAIGLQSGSCDLMSVYTNDRRYESSGAACYKVFRTFEVLNWCQFSGTDLAMANPFIVGRDEDRDGQPGNRPVSVVFSRSWVNGAYQDYIEVRSGGKTRREGPICTPGAGLANCPVSYTQSADPTGYSAVFSPGYFQYTQMIDVFDNVPPVITASTAAEYCAYSCTGTLSVSIAVTDACTPSDLDIAVYLRPFGNQAFKLPIAPGSLPAYPNVQASLGSVIVQESGVATSFTGTLPVGEHLLEIQVTDGCGNTSMLSKTLHVVDCKAPAISCTSGLVLNLMPHDGNNDGTIDGGRMTIWAKDYVVGSSASDCAGPVKYSIHLSRDPEINGDLSLLDQINRFVVSGNMSLGELLDASQTSEQLTCADAGKTLMVIVAAWDAAGNGDFCTTFLVVQDNMQLCGANSGVAVSGTVATEKGHTVEHVVISLSGTDSDNHITQTDGSYQFNNLSRSADYSITPLLDDDPDNGVTTFDLIEIGKHILHVKPLASPYRMIAADVDNNQLITSLDMIRIRRLILSVDSAFAHNTSWRFVDASFVFPNPSNPWATDFPEIVNINDYDGTQLSRDFVAIKVGDVTLDARANSLMSGTRSKNGAFVMEVADLSLEPGQTHRVAFRAPGLMDIEGCQFTLQLDPALGRIQEVHFGNAGSENIGTSRLEEGIITLSWNGVADSDLLLEVTLQAKSNAKLSEMLTLSSRFTAAEAYGRGAGLLDVALQFVEPALPGEFELFQNSPNPFSDQTTIGFQLPERSGITLTATDLSGRTVHLLSGQYEAGFHQMVLDSKDLPGSGVWMYTLATDTFTAGKKMIVLQP